MIRMGYRECPICNKKISDFLKHIRFIHNISNALELEQAIQKIQDQENKKTHFANYVDELKLKKKNNEISDEEYRELITKWPKENP